MSSTSSRANYARAIEANPDDPAGYAVYGDYLNEQGDPLGEIVALSLAERPELEERLRDLRSAYLEQWFPGFTRRRVYFSWEYGLLATIEAETNLGRELFEALSQCPAARFLRFLDLEVRQEDRRSSWVDPDDTTNPLPLMIERGFPRTLRRLELRFRMYELGDVDVDLAPLLPKLEFVEDLRLYDIERLGRLELPRLSSLELGDCDASVLAELSAARLDGLESLTIVDDWRHLPSLDLPGAPQLETLVLDRYVNRYEDPEPMRAVHRGEFAALAASPILRRVEELHFRGSIARETVEPFVRVAASFLHLRKIVLWAGGLDHSDLATLRAAFGPRIVVEE